MTAYDEIANGLVDSQIESIRRNDDVLEFVVRAPMARGAWQAMIVAAIAADTDDSIAYCEVASLSGAEPKFHSKALITLHARGAYETAPESELPTLLGGPVVIHRPGGRLAVELHRIVEHDPTPGDLETEWDPRLIGEGRYADWRDGAGRLIRASGYCSRCAWGIGMYGADYAHLAPRRTVA